MRRLRLSRGETREEFAQGMQLAGTAYLELERLREQVLPSEDLPCGNYAWQGHHLRVLQELYDKRYRTTRLLPIPLTGTYESDSVIEKTFSQRDLWDLFVFYRAEGTEATKGAPSGQGTATDFLLPMRALAGALGADYRSVTRWRGEAMPPEDGDILLAIRQPEVVMRLAMLQHMRASLYAAVRARQEDSRTAEIAEHHRARLVEIMFGRVATNREPIETVYENFSTHVGGVLVDYREAFFGGPNSPREPYRVGTPNLPPGAIPTELAQFDAQRFQSVLNAAPVIAVESGRR